MKLRLLVRFMEKVLHMNSSDDEPRADMYLPEFVPALGLVLLSAALVMVCMEIASFRPALLAAALAAALLGAAALLCWRNQTIRIVGDDEFIYTTFLGHSRSYRFSQITGIKQSSDSSSLILGTEKVHIESCAVMSQALIERINQALDKLA